MISHELYTLRGRDLAVAMTADLDTTLRQHFRQHPGRQEDLTFAYWRLSSGAKRSTLILGRALLPGPDERILDGNVSFTAGYLRRALAGLADGEGLALLHSHLGPGWQRMSADDIVAERDRLASAVSGRTGLPLLGMTWGTDGTWSARIWGRSAPFAYQRVEVASVRVAGPTALAISFHPVLRPAPPELPAQAATISVWGKTAQDDIARTRAGIIGLGSVGSIVAEGLSRIGVSDVILIDHDVIEVRNLDRTLHASPADAKTATPKVVVAERAMQQGHTAIEQAVQAKPVSLLSRDGIETALDCDVLVSCVDRLLPRWILNAIAYAHLIPVVDGGILARTTADGRPLHIDWRIHTVGPGRACLVCLGALTRSDVGLDREGLLDDPDYIAGLTPAERERYNRRNVFPFSLAVAGHEILHIVGMIANSQRVSGIGPQHYHAYPGQMTATPTTPCKDDCETQALVATAIDLAEQFDNVEPQRTANDSQGLVGEFRPRTSDTPSAPQDDGPAPSPEALPRS